MTLTDAMYVDLGAVAVAGALILRHPGARFSHPGVIYLLFHIWVVTFRGWAIDGGATTFLDVSADAVAKAVVLCDVFLISATFGLLAVSGSRTGPPVSVDPSSAHALRVSSRRISAVAIPVGLISLLAVGYVPGIGTGTTEVVTSYQTIAILWPALCLLALGYARPFSPWVLIALAGYLGVLALQGHSRFRFAVPVVMLLLIVLDKRGLRWPKPWMLIPLALAVMVFLPLKQIGLEVRGGGASLSSIVDAVSMSNETALSGTNAEQALLDQAGITIELVDDRGETFAGRPYLALLTLPVPRPLWPDKPSLSEHLRELSNADFPLATVGAITTLPGDLYLNFGLPGLVGLGAALGALVGTLCRRAYQSDRVSVRRFLYVLFAAILIQVARDGLASVVVFTLVNCTPWLVIAIYAHRVRRKLPSSETRACAVQEVKEHW